jgi:hypothetical protein
VPNDFLGELVAALRGVLTTEDATVATAHGEPISCEFRFWRPPGTKDIRFNLVVFPTFDERGPTQGEEVLALGSSGDTMCRAFCRGLCRLQSLAGVGAYQAIMRYPFPVEGVAELCALLGGEFAADEPGPT